MLPRRRPLPRAPLLLAALAALALLAGCGDERQPADAAGELAGEGPGDGGEQPATLELTEPAEPGDPVDLPEGVAAIADGEEIPEEAVESRFQAAAEAPEVAERLEGAEGDAVAATFRAQIVQTLVLQTLIAQSAEEMGLEPSEEEVAAVEEQVVAEFDGDKQDLQEALRSQGVTSEHLGEEIRFAARFEAIREEVAAGLDPDEAERAEATDVDPADIALDDWLDERLSTADVAVDREYGVWSPEEGKVAPASAAGAAE